MDTALATPNAGSVPATVVAPQPSFMQRLQALPRGNQIGLGLGLHFLEIMVL